MHVIEPTSVLWVVDPDLGEVALTMMPGAAIWAVASPANRAAEWRARELGAAFTLLSVDGTRSRESWLLDHVDTVDQHHNQHSQRVGYTVLRVVGAPLTTAIAAWWREFGFVTFEAGEDGFLANKS